MIDRRWVCAAIVAAAGCRVTTFEPVPFGVNLYVGEAADRSAGAVKMELLVYAADELRYAIDRTVATPEDLQARLAMMVANAPSGARFVIDLRFGAPEVEAALPAADVARLIAHMRAAMPEPARAGAIVQVHSALLGP